MGILGLLEDVVEIAIAPITITANVAQVVTKPVAEMAEELVEESEELKDG